MALAVSRLPDSGDFCRLLIIFSNNSDQDQDRYSIGPDLDPYCWTSDSVPKWFFFKVELEKGQLWKITQHATIKSATQIIVLNPKEKQVASMFKMQNIYIVYYINIKILVMNTWANPEG